jgi:polyphosphate kinase 2 (PPK2 family)
MLEQTDLSQKLGKASYARIMPVLSEDLHRLQKTSWEAGLPVIILFEGWDAAGKGACIQRLARALDPRGYKLYTIQAARPHETKRPWMWRFWQALPARGEWAIFDHSWYGRVMAERVDRTIPESEWRRAYRDIIEFERTLVEDGYLLLKFFLHISKEEQRRRFNKLSKDPNTTWHVTEQDWMHHRHYEDWMRAYEEAFERTATEWAPWTIIAGTSRRYCSASVCRVVALTLSGKLGLEYTLPEFEESSLDGSSPSTDRKTLQNQTQPQAAPQPDGKSSKNSSATGTQTEVE